MRPCLLLLAGIPAFAAPAHASPGLGNDADGAEIEAGSASAALRHDRLVDGPSGGDDIIMAGASYAISDRFQIGLQGSFVREGGAPRRADAASIEALWAIGQAGDLRFAVMGTYDIGFDRPDSAEARLIVQRIRGPLDLRVNLVTAKSLETGEKVEFGYAFAAEYAATERFTLGLHGYGEFGSFNRFLPEGGHAAGPVATWGIGPGSSDVQLQVGYLFVFGHARSEARGQVRIGLEFGF